MARGASVIKLNPPSRRSSNRRRDMEVKIGDAEVKVLKQLVEYEGLSHMAREIGVDPAVLLRVCAGWFDRCHVNSQQIIRAFFAEKSD